MFSHGHALVIGVSTYLYHDILNVPIARKDAEEVASVLRDRQLCGYPPEQVIMLSDRQATRQAILSALDNLAQRVPAEGTVTLFYVGHGSYGADGTYYLMCHDTRLQDRKVVAGTGISQQELLARLKALRAQRVLLLFNACHSGEISPMLSSEETFTGDPIPATTAMALLATGQGRIIITACREAQVSFIGRGERSIFAQALGDGLRGKGVSSQRGYISAFDLYTHLYYTVSEQVQQLISAETLKKYGGAQEPELTILKGVGPFAVALYRGASALGTFEESGQPPAGMAVHEVREERSRQQLQQIGDDLINGSVTINDGTVQGPVTGVNMGTINTTYQSGGVNLGSSQIGSISSVTGGDSIGGDSVGGDKISIGDISNSGSAVGRGAQATVTQGGAELARLFSQIYDRIQALPAHPGVEKQHVVDAVKKIEEEAGKQEGQVNTTRAERRLRQLAEMAPDIFEVTASALLNPVAGIATTLKKIAEKLRAERRGKQSEGA